LWKTRKCSKLREKFRSKEIPSTALWILWTAWVAWIQPRGMRTIGSAIHTANRRIAGLVVTSGPHGLARGPAAAAGLGFVITHRVLLQAPLFAQISSP